METDWAENRAKIPQDFIRDTLGKLLDQVYSTRERDKFRTRLERTRRRQGHRDLHQPPRHGRGLHLAARRARRHRQTVWQPREPDPELEAEFLRRLMVRLGAQRGARQGRWPRRRAPAQRAEIRKGIDGAELLQVNEPFDRAWRRVGLALDRVGFTVEDRDRAKGLYFVRYVDPESEMAIKDRERGFLAQAVLAREIRR